MLTFAEAAAERIESIYGHLDVDHAEMPIGHRRAALHLVGAGSCASSGADLQRQFYVVELDDTDVRLTSFVRHRDTPTLFEPEPGRIIAPFPVR